MTNVGFSERLENIMALASALSNAGHDPSESQPQARVLEKEILEKASTSDEYQELVRKILDHLQPTPIEDAVPLVSADADEILNAEGPSLGAYDCATFHQDGQTSTVFKARAKTPGASGTIVALKVTHPASLTDPHNSVREARILDACKHDGVVPLLETFTQSGGRFILVFPFLRQDLQNLLRTNTLTRKQSGLVFTALFEALAFIHSLGIIHRDVKPANILLKSASGPAYLTDFGIAWSPGDKDSEPPDNKITDVGTTCYRPPELLFGCKFYDSSLDMWAAGCVVGEMVKKCHSPIFDGGPLGSELSLIKSMFTTLGTPNDTTWPSAQSYPDWEKVTFQDFPSRTWEEILPGAHAAAVDFVANTVCFESTVRLTAAKALEHPFNSELDAPA